MATFPASHKNSFQIFAKNNQNKFSKIARVKQISARCLWKLLLPRSSYNVIIKNLQWDSDNVPDSQSSVKAQVTSSFTDVTHHCVDLWHQQITVYRHQAFQFFNHGLQWTSTFLTSSSKELNISICCKIRFTFAFPLLEYRVKSRHKTTASTSYNHAFDWLSRVFYVEIGSSYRRNERGKGDTIPGRRVTMGHRMTAGGTAKCQQCHKYFLQYSTFASERPQVRTWGRQTFFLPRAPRPWKQCLEFQLKLTH